MNADLSKLRDSVSSALSGINIKKVWNAATSVLVGLAVLLSALLWGFQLVGFDVFVVQSGSMEPEYHVGALVYVLPADPSELEVGDVITFNMGGAVVGTHRIIEVLDDNGTPAFRTKGDANDTPDASAVSPDAIIGKVRFTIPKLGYVAEYISRPSGRFAAISVVAALLLLIVLPDLLFGDKKKSTDKGDAK